MVRVMLLNETEEALCTRGSQFCSQPVRWRLTVACSQTDAGITGAIKSKMAADDTVKASEINVDTHDHVVTLNGTVGSQAEKERALMIARNTNGVSSVIDDLRSRPRRHVRLA